MSPIAHTTAMSAVTSGRNEPLDRAERVVVDEADHHEREREEDQRSAPCSSVSRAA